MIWRILQLALQRREIATQSSLCRCLHCTEKEPAWLSRQYRPLRGCPSLPLCATTSSINRWTPLVHQWLFAVGVLWINHLLSITWHRRIFGQLCGAHSLESRCLTQIVFGFLHVGLWECNCASPRWLGYSDHQLFSIDNILHSWKATDLFSLQEDRCQLWSPIERLLMNWQY